MAGSFERVYECLLPSTLGAFQKMATWHMRDLTLIVTMLWASVSQGVGRKPLPAMLSTVLLQIHKHRGTQISCSTLRERRRPVRVGEVLDVVLD